MAFLRPNSAGVRFPIVLAVLLAGCGSGTNTGSGSSGGGTPVVGLSVSALNFSAQTAGTTSAAQSITVTNSGTAALTLTSVSLSGTNASSFAETSACGTTVAAGASCAITVSFAPAAVGTYAATITLSDSASSSPQTITLSGTATAVPAPVVSLSASSLNFVQTVGLAGTAQTVTLTNTGNATLTVSGVSITGAGAISFTESTTCSGAIVANGNCIVSVSFSPTAAGTFAAAIAFTDNAAGTSQSISLSGTATGAPALTLGSSALTFTQAAESTSAAQAVTLTNSGSAALTLGTMTLSGTNATNFATTTTCGATLAAAASCVVSVTFTPSMAAAFTASLTIPSNAAASPASVGLSGTGTGKLTINTSNPTDWQISNGAITLDWNSQTGNLWSVHLVGYPDDMVDTTTTSNGHPDGLYMDNTGQGTGTVTASYSQSGNEYIDWWISTASNSTNAFTYSMHYIITANDTGFHVYSTVGHSATDIAGSIGQWQYVFRMNLSKFTETYSVNTGLNNLGVLEVPQPSTASTGSTDPGRQVQNAVVDLHGFTLPAGFTREFYTKYDFASTEYLHQEHGVYGSQYGAWLVFPSKESLVGGPTKQDLIFTNNILIGEALSSHLDNSLGYTPAQSVPTDRLFGPYYFHFNALNATNTTPDSLYAEATTYLPSFHYLYDSDASLASNGYVASSTRGTVASTISGGGSATANTAWVVLSDPAKNFQYSSNGLQYWSSNNATGAAQLSGVAPGTYRLSSYVLGQWGELRQDGVAVAANQTTTLPSLTFTPENFGTSAPIWTIGTPDRSAHEFLHGTNSAGQDDREFYGTWNYWQDFASTSGTEIYYATAEGSTPATNNPNAINYVQWGSFDPGLFAGIYNASDDTTDGYQYAIPTYVKSLSGESGTNGVTTSVPPLTIHFTTTAAQQAQGQYAVLSAGLAATEGSVIATLNGHQLIWHYLNASDAMVRSGLSGYYQWIALQWPTSQLNPAGQDNVLTLGVSQADGVMWDALRMEITDTSADPATTGWHDYEYVNSSRYTAANDAAANN